jgi:hypothetical protein
MNCIFLNTFHGMKNLYKITLSFLIDYFLMEKIITLTPLILLFEIANLIDALAQQTFTDTCKFESSSNPALATTAP